MVVSVIMPVYNAGAYLKEAVDSILSQTFEDFEFLIFNDGSIDDSYSILQSYNDKRIKIYHSEVNTGYLKHLNHGLHIATGHYIARMDADDIAYPDRFAKQIRLLDQNKDIGACGTWALRFTGESETPSSSIIWKTEAEHEGILRAALRRNPLIHPTSMFRNELVKKCNLRYNADCYPAEDYQFWMDCSQVSKLANVQEVLLKYRDHSNNISIVNPRQKEIASRIRATHTFSYFGMDASESEKTLLFRFLNKDRFQKDEYPLLDLLLNKIITAATKKGEQGFAKKLIRSHYEWFLKENPPEQWKDFYILRNQTMRLLKGKTLLKYGLRFFSRH